MCASTHQRLKGASGIPWNPNPSSELSLSSLDTLCTGFSFFLLGFVSIPCCAWVRFAHVFLFVSFFLLGILFVSYLVSYFVSFVILISIPESGIFRCRGSYCKLSGQKALFGQKINTLKNLPSLKIFLDTTPWFGYPITVKRKENEKQGRLPCAE